MITPALTQSTTKRSRIHTPRLCFPGGAASQDCAPQFLCSYLSDTWRRASGYWEKSNCFSISLPPLPSLRTLSMRSLHKYSSDPSTWQRRGCIRMQFLLSAALQHFTPGVTHQPSHHSAVKCQQSQNPQPGPLSAAPGLMSTSLLLNEFPASFFFLLISILCVCYSKSCLLETEPRKYRQTLFKIGSSNSSILSFEVFFFFFLNMHLRNFWV